MFKNIWFQIHWFIGITAGTILMTIGLTGAALSFREEITDALNPGVMHVQVREQQPLTPQQLLEQIGAAEPGRRVASITLAREAGAAVRVVFVPPPGVRRGEARYADPYTGQVSGPVTSMEFFEIVERFHRWLLLPTEIGKIVLGTLALALLTLALSGLYLRWPRRPLSLQAWFRLDFKLQGRSFLWNLHSIIGTWALAMYVIFSITGAYWALDWFKQGVDTLAGQERAPQAKRGAPPKDKQDAPAPLDLTLAWNAFLAKAPHYQNAQLRLPEKTTQAVQILFLDEHAPHERARSRMTVLPQSGEVKQLELYEDKSAGGKFIAAIYPLHMGTFFGLPGRIVMAIASLMLPLFGITGWMLYLDRRRKKAALRAERAALEQAGIATTPAAKEGAQAAQYLVAYASQAGQAERMALHAAALLRQSGAQATVQPLARMTPENLRHHPRILFIASTFGEGEAPDSARAFERRMRAASGQSLAHVEYALLALGDSNYTRFCGFGHTLDHWLRNRGAKALFPPVEVDRMDAGTLQKWERMLADHGIVTAAAVAAATASSSPSALPPQAGWQAWSLAQRRQLNPGSQGEPIFHLELRKTDAADATDIAADAWQPGALAEILPRHAADRVALLLQRLQLDGSTIVDSKGTRLPLQELLARSVLPVGQAAAHARDAQALADTLQPLAARSYSVASVPQDGALHLLVRQTRHEDGLGLASGWLTEYAEVGAALDVRLVANANFGPAGGDVPAIFIGNGSGMAGLRGHLRARVHAGHARNWLLFGERNRRHDFLYQDELEQWLAAGKLARLDLAFSSDQNQRVYVQDRLREAADELRRWIADGAVVYVCGSLEGMAAGVDAALAEALGERALEDLIEQGRYRRDVY
ncbi:MULTISPECIES: sulfite reductase flavoprotein subunit alpha [unclassified Herbaspirillum]|uniref:PepSY domain-containing protein n=1 Tax=unclassified Herbaspirillum TaxID=2624150 RepID=UPI001153F8FD|nr:MULTISPECIES: sulfite reductase flavoprotein subunit alpha [unclassified Herbaspirillum]MBB5390722.1 sulfite reductase (NADPH) flavoprotein alpha-component [Herbaspirillum sp. SJZ102]TQK08793.1 sulfite reductase (NADPH) flavoprotein alpha-component [Herbaspirillum sp. SJZ130]TQK14520.1 sulfite reductase (NADPH) flavoprotein alpha-component [Herbaspirillum sp. SJZ106]